jgi:two-component system NarL family sensor kinase
VAIVVALVGGYVAVRSVAIGEAKDDTRRKAVEAGQLVESALRQGLLRGDAGAVAALDDVVVARVLDDAVVRVKLWSSDGRVLYSDEPAQIGGRFPLDADQRLLLREGGVEVEVSDLGRPENALDRGEGDLLEAYTRIRTPGGEPVLFEIYERLDSVTADARRLLRALAAPILGALLVIVLVQAPLVWSLTRRLQRGHEEREALLANAIAASNRERRRVASYLHDGPVQDVAGVAYALAPLADAAERRGAAGEAEELRAVVAQLRQNVRDLRTLLVDLHPPNLAAAGLETAIGDVVSPLEAQGVLVTVALDGADRLGPEQEALVFRVAQEAVRNVLAHADAHSVDLRLDVGTQTAQLSIVDDGRGFTAGVRSHRVAEGHVGLSLLEELVRQAGGRLTVTSDPGQGTRIELEVSAA